MAKVRYEHSLEYYTVDNFIKESQKIIGKPVSGVLATSTFDQALCDFISAYAQAVGDNNPLYTDIEYALDTKYNGMISLPTFLITIQYPMSEGVLFDGPYPLVGLEAEYDWEWNDVIRMNDKFTTEHILKDVYERSSDKGRTVYVVSECKYWNQLKELVATCTGTYAAIARAESITEIPEVIKEGFRNYLITDRKVHHWTDEEVENFLADVKYERRGANIRSWEDVNVGDKLGPMNKEALTTTCLINYGAAVFSSKAYPTFERNQRKWLNTPAYLRVNPLVNWPYDVPFCGFEDPFMAPASGMPSSFAPGSLRAGFGAHLLSDWMGDDGFIRRLKVDVSEPYIYHDALKITGEVVEKYKEKLGGKIYGAVDIKMKAVNQLGQNVAPGTATVYLPSICQGVELPIR